MPVPWLTYLTSIKPLAVTLLVFDLDVGVALGAIAAADAGTIITRSIDGAAGDLDVRGVGRIAAAADGCTGVAGGCDVAVSDMDNGLEAFGVPVGGL